MHRTPHGTALSLMFVFLIPNVAFSINETTVRCGDIIEGEFSTDRSTHEYYINMEPGSVLEYAAIPIGDFLSFYTSVVEPSGNYIYQMSPYDRQKNLKVRTGTLSARGDYRILLHNYNAGIYTLHVGCILRDGTEVEPGAAVAVHTPPPATIQPVSEPTPTPQVDAPSNTSELSAKINEITEYANSAGEVIGAVGEIAATARSLRSLFPRREKKPERQQATSRSLIAESQQLAQPRYETPPSAAPTYSPPPPPAAPTIALPRLKLDIDLDGMLMVQGADYFGFQFSAEEGAQVDLRFERTSGNLGLTLALVGPGNIAIFQSSLLANNRLATDLTLPMAGDYSLTVHRSEPPPSSPEPTSFHVAVARRVDAGTNGVGTNPATP